MEKLLLFMTLNTWGLLLGLMGTGLVACSIGKNTDNARFRDEKGEITYVAAVLHPQWFWWGMGLIFVGFLLQFLS